MNTTLVMQIEQLNRELSSQVPSKIVAAYRQSIEDLKGRKKVWALIFQIIIKIATTNYRFLLFL